MQILYWRCNIYQIYWDLLCKTCIISCFKYDIPRPSFHSFTSFPVGAKSGQCNADSLLHGDRIYFFDFLPLYFQQQLRVIRIIYFLCQYLRSGNDTLTLSLDVVRRSHVSITHDCTRGTEFLFRVRFSLRRNFGRNIQKNQDER